MSLDKLQEMRAASFDAVMHFWHSFTTTDRLSSDDHYSLHMWEAFHGVACREIALQQAPNRNDTLRGLVALALMHLQEASLSMGKESGHVNEAMTNLRTALKMMGD